MSKRSRARKKTAGETFYLAYEYYRIGRYPVPSSPEKMTCYKGALRTFLKAAPYMDPLLERCEIPFEGKKVVGYLQVPKGVHRPPVVMHWGGVDGWKEDRRTNNDVLLELGIACFTHRHAGRRGESLLGPGAEGRANFLRGDGLSRDARRHRRQDGSPAWAAASAATGRPKLAHTEPKRLRGAVNWGAGVHRTFQEEWLRPALTLTASQYLMGPASLLDARSYIFGVKSLAEVLQIAPTLSLVTQGLIDQPCAPLLVHQRQRRRPASDQRSLSAGGAWQPEGFAHHRRRRPHGAEKGQSNDEVVGIVTQWLERKTRIGLDRREVWHASQRSIRKKT